MQTSNKNSNYKIKPFSHVEENAEHFLNLKNHRFLKVTEFHGHVCPGSAIGYKAAEIAIKELYSSFSEDEELVCITENDTCAVDAIQVVTGCTFGKGNLIFHDYEKQAYTFINRESKESVRISMKSSFSIDKIDPNLSKLRVKVNSGKASELEKEDLKKIIAKVSEEIINIPDDEIFNIEHVKAKTPEKARIFKSVKCQECNEMVSMHRVKQIDDEYYCIPCYNQKEN
jgi:formylmethanofuran dehydrogenase subunit E